MINTLEFVRYQLSHRGTEPRTFLSIVFALFLLNWNVFLLGGFPLTWITFIGPFFGVGVLLTLAVGVRSRISEFLFHSLANSLLALTSVGMLGAFLSKSAYDRSQLVLLFNVLYISLLLYVVFISPSRPDFDIRTKLSQSPTRTILLCSSALITCFLSPLLMKTYGYEHLNIFAYLLLGSIMIVAIFGRIDGQSAIFIVLTIGVGMVWLRAFSTFDYFAGDGRYAIRLAREMMDPAIPASGTRPGDMLSVKYLLPALSLLFNVNLDSIATYFIPTVVGSSLVGIFHLVRTWLSRRDALAAVFLVGTKTTFFTSPIINYRTAFAFVILIAVFICLVRVETSRKKLLPLYLMGVIGFHDTVGLYLLIVLCLYSVLTPLVAYFLPNSSVRPMSGVNIAALSMCIYYILFFATTSFERMVMILSYTVSTYATGESLELQRDASSTAESVSDSLAGVIFLGNLYFEIALMALGTAIILFCWVTRRTMAGRLRECSTDVNSELLLVAVSCVFGVLLVLPRLGVSRVYLYSSPVLVSLIPLFFRQIESIIDRIPTGRESSIIRNKSSYVSVLLTILVLLSLLNNIGILFVALGGSGTDGPHVGSRGVDNYYFSESDVVAKAWLTDHHTQGGDLYGDYYGWNLLVSEPGLQSNDHLPADEDIRSLEGCIFIRSMNTEHGELYINHPKVEIQPYDDELIDARASIYSSNAVTVSCR